MLITSPLWGSLGELIKGAMKIENINISEIKSEIIKKYGTMYKCAESLKISSTQLSRWIRKPSERFYLLLIENGLIKKDEREIHTEEREYFMNEYRKIIEEQGKLLSDQRLVIEQMKAIIDSKENTKQKKKKNDEESSETK